ncbi:Gaa1-like protein [Tirmania nivea]|nr:Gaa1-like protein [Tirmania nivea]
MGLLSGRLSTIRILTVLPYLSALCVVVGITWLLLLPLESNSRRTYISENALLPGQASTYFGGSEQNIFWAYRHEVADLANATDAKRVEVLGNIFAAAGLKVGRQKYTYTASGQTYSGENVYAILQAPRGDATEATVLSAPWKNLDDIQNTGGVALVTTLARYLKRWSVWSKDIIFLITSDSLAGPQAWVDAYHDQHTANPGVESLPLKSGAIQGAIVLDYPSGGNFESIHIVYDGVNGQLPNLDLVNTAGNVALHHFGIRPTLQEMWDHNDSYKDRLRTMLRGMVNQGLGHARGGHSVFVPYHVDAVTVQVHGDGWHNEVSLGRFLESMFRSLNNLLEHFHQSFFFYLLMAQKRFVSIGTYLPSAMLIAVNFTLGAIGLWVDSLSSSPLATASSTGKSTSPTTAAIERDLCFPLTTVLTLHFLGILPLTLFNHLPTRLFTPTFSAFLFINLVLPFLLSSTLTHFIPAATRERQLKLIKCFSLLFLGMALSALATLNFSLALGVGVGSAALTFIPVEGKGKIVRGLLYMVLQCLSPGMALAGIAYYWEVGVEEVLREASFGWWVSGMWTQVVVWCVWWPAWLCGGVLLAEGLVVGRGERKAQEDEKKKQ